MSIQLTKRDLKLMLWMNAVGFVTMGHIVAWMGVCKPTAYARLKKLVAHGYILHERIFYGLPGIYRVSQEGVKCSGSPLPILRHVPLGSYHHDLKTAQLGLDLVQRWGGAFTSERMVRHELGLKGVGQIGHVPDGIWIKEDKQYAIEVELSPKGQRRLDKIMKHYLKCFEYEVVYYFCGNAMVQRKIEAYQEQLPFLKVFSLKESAVSAVAALA